MSFFRENLTKTDKNEVLHSDMKNLFSDDKKNLSMIRVLCFLLTILVMMLIIEIGIIIIIRTELCAEIIRELTTLILGILGITIAGKTIQKFAERDKNGN